jgi:ADP-ribosylglycohydrolase
LFGADRFAVFNCRWKRGDWTDDTDQMILIMDSIAESGGVNEKLFAAKLKYWIRNGFPELGDQGGMGLGMTVGAVCHSDDFLTNPHAASERIWNQTGQKLAANGAVMRTSILGVYEYRDLDRVLANTERYAKTTHFDGRCVGSCVVVTSIIARMLAGAPCATREDVEALIADGASRALPFVQTAYHDEFKRHLNAARVEDLALDEARAIGYTFKCFGSGIWALRQSVSSDFQTTMNTLIREAGDADTNGAVAGALIGTKLGYTALPQSWLAAMPNKRWLDKKVVNFLTVTGFLPAAPSSAGAGSSAAAPASSAASASS